jgi:uncharacterized membrane protein
LFDRALNVNQLGNKKEVGMITKNTFWTVAVIIGVVLLVQKLMAADGIEVKQAHT